MSKRLFKVTVPRRKIVRYEREVWADNEAQAVEIVNLGTAWPQSYDELTDEVIDGDPVVVEVTDPEVLKACETDNPDYVWP